MHDKTQLLVQQYSSMHLKTGCSPNKRLVPLMCTMRTQKLPRASTLKQAVTLSAETTLSPL